MEKTGRGMELAGGKKTKTVARGRDVMCNRLVRYHDGGKPVATVLHQRMHAGC